MKDAIIIVRVLLGLVFAVFGSNAFLHFIPVPPMQGDAGAFMGALFHSRSFSSGFIAPNSRLSFSRKLRANATRGACVG